MYEAECSIDVHGGSVLGGAFLRFARPSPMDSNLGHAVSVL